MQNLASIHIRNELLWAQVLMIVQTLSDSSSTDPKSFQPATILLAALSMALALHHKPPKAMTEQEYIDAQISALDVATSEILSVVRGNPESANTLPPALVTWLMKAVNNTTFQ